MKLLITYDGSECSDAAIIDLRRAGLPSATEAVVLSVAESSLPLPNNSYAAISAGMGGNLPHDVEGATNDNDLSRAEAFAAQAADRIRADFPAWRVNTETWVDDAETAIVRKADSWKSDLVVVGSRGHSSISRLLLGSVSQYVLRHASCSVRVSRHHLHPQDRPIRLLVGIDNADDAKAVLHSIATRNWPAGTEVHVLGVLDARPSNAPLAVTAAGIPSAAPIADEPRERLSKIVHEAVQALANVGLQASPQILAGHPGEVLVAEGERWSADCVFVGARRLTKLQRLLLGSVSAHVASHAHCSVEIVRQSVVNT